MEDCANWLKTFINDVRIDFVATQQPFWTVNPQGNSPRAKDEP